MGRSSRGGVVLLVESVGLQGEVFWRDQHVRGRVGSECSVRGPGSRSGCPWSAATVQAWCGVGSRGKVRVNLEDLCIPP